MQDKRFSQLILYLIPSDIGALLLIAFPGFLPICHPSLCILICQGPPFYFFSNCFLPFLSIVLPPVFIECSVNVNFLLSLGVSLLPSFLFLVQFCLPIPQSFSCRSHLHLLFRPVLILVSLLSDFLQPFVLSLIFECHLLYLGFI